MTSDQSKAGGTREPGGTLRTMDPGGAEGGRSQGGDDKSTGRSGVTGLTARDTAEWS